MEFIFEQVIERHLRWKNIFRTTVHFLRQVPSIPFPASDYSIVVPPDLKLAAYCGGLPPGDCINSYLRPRSSVFRKWPAIYRMPIIA